MAQVTVYNRLGQSIRRSQNLSAVIRHAGALRKHGFNFETECVVTVEHTPEMREPYRVVFYWRNGDSCSTQWGDWRVLLPWLCGRRSLNTSHVKVKGAAGFVDLVITSPQAAATRKRGIYVTGA